MHYISVGSLSSSPPGALDFGCLITEFILFSDTPFNMVFCFSFCLLCGKCNLLNWYILIHIYGQCILLSGRLWSRRDLCIEHQRIVLPTLISESRETKHVCPTQSLANYLEGEQWELTPRVEKGGFAETPGIWMCFLVNPLGTNSLHYLWDSR